MIYDMNFILCRNNNIEHGLHILSYTSLQLRVNDYSTFLLHPIPCKTNESRECVVWKITNRACIGIGIYNRGHVRCYNNNSSNLNLANMDQRKWNRAYSDKIDVDSQLKQNRYLNKANNCLCIPERADI